MPEAQLLPAHTHSNAIGVAPSRRTADVALIPRTPVFAPTPRGAVLPSARTPSAIAQAETLQGAQNYQMSRIVYPGPMAAHHRPDVSSNAFAARAALDGPNHGTLDSSAALSPPKRLNMKRASHT